MIRRLCLLPLMTLAIIAAAAPPAWAAPILHFVTITEPFVQGNGPTQLGRLFRSGTPQDWAGTETFPGVLFETEPFNNAIAFFVAPGLLDASPFLEITVDTNTTNLFASAYADVYVPDSAGAPFFGFDVGWLGDAGKSGLSTTFRVVIPAGKKLILVLNDIVTQDPFAKNYQYNVTVDAYASPNDVVPEPASLALLGSGLAALAMKRKRNG